MSLLAVRPLSAIFDNVLGDHLQRQDNQRRYNDNIIQLAEDRYEVRNEVKRQKEIADGHAQEQLCRPGRPAVSQHQPVHIKLPLEGARYGLQPVEHVVGFLGLTPQHEIKKCLGRFGY